MQRLNGVAKALLLVGLNAVALAAVEGGSAQGEAHPFIEPKFAGDATHAVQAADGSVAVIGSFVSVDGVERRSMMRLLADGSTDPAFNGGFFFGNAYEPVRGVTGDPEGNVFVGSWTPNQTLIRRFAPDGQQTTLLSASGSHWLEGTEYGPDGSLYVSGNIGNTVLGLARMDPMTGAVDATWRPTTGAPSLMTFGTDGYLYVWGLLADPPSPNPVYALRISLAGAGEVDPDWRTGLFQLNIKDAAFGADGWIYVAGYTFFPHLGERRLFRLSAASGQVDPGWNPAPNGVVRSIAFEGDSLRVVGDFTQIGGEIRPGLARLSLLGSGAADPAWPPAFDLHRGSLNGALPLSDGHLLYGAIRRIDDQPAFGIARLNEQGGAPLAHLESRAPVSGALSRTEDGRLYLAGDFDKLGSVFRDRLVRLLPDGAIDPDWRPSLDIALPYRIAALAEAGPWVYLVINEGETPQVRLRRVSRDGAGAMDPAFAVPIGLHGQAGASYMSLAADGDHLYMGGYFHSVAGLPRPGLARFSIGGGVLDVQWQPVEVSQVSRIELVDDDVMFTYRGPQGWRLARISRTQVGQLFPHWQLELGDGLYMASHRAGDGHIYVYGAYSTLLGTARRGLARLNPNDLTRVDATWAPNVQYEYPPGEPYVQGVEVFEDRVFAFGNFPMQPGWPFGPRWMTVHSTRGAGQPYPAESGYYDAPVTAMAKLDGTRLLVTGQFSSIEDFLVRWGLVTRSATERLFANGFDANP